MLLQAPEPLILTHLSHLLHTCREIALDIGFDLDKGRLDVSV